jgi:hypothetical protein
MSGEVRRTIAEVLEYNDWLNGNYDLMEGDISAITKADEFYRTWTDADDVEELWRMLRNYTGVFKHGDLLFFADHNYGIFVYKIPDGKDYVEHLNQDISLEKLREVIESLVG